MASLSVAVMAHRVRAAAARRVLAGIDGSAELVFDENPIPSNDREQRWATGRRSWEAAYKNAGRWGADWCLVVQDDAILCRDLVAGLEQALKFFPSDDLGQPLGLVSAYTGTGRPNQHSVRKALAYADEHDLAWACTKSLNWGPAIIVPTWTVPEMLGWCSGERRVQGSPYDYRIGVYYRDIMGWRSWYTVPSLVSTGRLRSLIGNDRGPRRVAHRFIGRESSALGVDWGRVPAGGLDPLVDVVSRARSL